jgi:hypothetical protein
LADISSNTFELTEEKENFINKKKNQLFALLQQTLTLLELFFCTLPHTINNSIQEHYKILLQEFNTEVQLEK